MAELQEHEIQEIIDTYARTNHTVRTAEITHHSTTTVWKYLHERGLCQPRGRARLKMTDAQLSDAIDAGLTRAEIAEKFGIHITNLDRRMRQIGRYATHAKMESKADEWHTTEGSKKLVEKKLGGRFEYVAYRNRQIKIRCKECMETIEVARSTVNRGYIKCKNCEEKNLVLKKLVDTLQCVVDSKTPRRCPICGEEFCSPYQTKVYCSERCKKKQKNRRHRKNRQQRGIKQKKVQGRHYRDRCRHYNVEYVPGVTLKRIYARDQGICQICGKPTDWNDKSYGTGFGPLYPTIDHIVALANGGGHRLDNVQLAHALCNAIKSNNELEIREAVQNAKI